MPAQSEQHVLVVDGPSETETVLRTALRPLGVGISRVRSGVDSPPVEPSVVVLHDSVTASQWEGVPRVIIGSSSVEEGTTAIGSPFEYRDLVAAIDRLLTQVT